MYAVSAEFHLLRGILESAGKRRLSTNLLYKTRIPSEAMLDLCILVRRSTLSPFQPCIMGRDSFCQPSWPRPRHTPLLPLIFVHYSVRTKRDSTLTRLRLPTRIVGIHAVVSRGATFLPFLPRFFFNDTQRCCSPPLLYAAHPCVASLLLMDEVLFKT